VEQFAVAAQFGVFGLVAGIVVDGIGRRDDAVDEGVEFAPEVAHLRSERQRFAAVAAMAAGIAVALLRAGPGFRLRSASFGGQVGNIIVPNIFEGGTPCRLPRTRRARPRRREDGGIDNGMCGAGVHHDGEVGAGAMCSRGAFGRVRRTM
jgi:hypothetical protein